MMGLLLGTVEPNHAMRAVVTACGLAGLLLIMRHRRWGWPLGAVAQLLWGIYFLFLGEDPQQAVVTAFYCTVYLVGWRRWCQEEREHRATARRLLDLAAPDATPDVEVRRGGYPSSRRTPGQLTPPPPGRGAGQVAPHRQPDVFLSDRKPNPPPKD